MTLSDQQLIARAVVDKDRGAFSTLVRRHQSGVRSVLRQMVCGNDALGDDLAQETFIRAWQSLASFRGDAKFSSWLYRIAWNVFLSDARCTRHREASGHAAEETALSATPMETVVTRLAIESSLKHLSPETRMALTLTYGHDLTHEEAASILGWPLGTLKTNVLRGKIELRRHLSRGEDAP